MNNGRAAYYPVLFYALALVLIWLASWIVSVVQLLSGVGLGVTSIVSGEGVRWALLSVTGTLDSAPWGVAFFLLLVVGLLSGSGIMQPFAKLFSRNGVSNNELRAIFFSMAVLLLYLLILFVFTVSPWHALLGVTGELLSSPLARGWLLVLFVGVLLVALVYGFMYGNYRTLTDVVCSAGSFMKKYVPALLAMVPAAGIVPCLQFAGFDVLLVGNEGVADIVAGLLYAFPFVYVALLPLLGRK